MIEQIAVTHSFFIAKLLRCQPSVMKEVIDFHVGAEIKNFSANSIQIYQGV
jgi:hypothetical protein